MMPVDLLLLLQIINIGLKKNKLVILNMKEEIRKVVVLDWEDRIKLQQYIKDLEEIVSSYKKVCKDTTSINNVIYYLKTIKEKIK